MNKYQIIDQLTETGSDAIIICARTVYSTYSLEYLSTL
jgi:hypothetical protein